MEFVEDEDEADRQQSDEDDPVPSLRRSLRSLARLQRVFQPLHAHHQQRLTENTQTCTEHGFYSKIQRLHLSVENTVRLTGFVALPF